MASEQFADGGVDNVLAIERSDVFIGSVGACNAAVLVRWWGTMLRIKEQRCTSERIDYVGIVLGK